METPFETSYSMGRRARILVAEDDAEMRRLVIESLRADGHEAVDVTDGGQLLVQITSFYLVVTDVRMPVCSGLEIVQALRDADWSTPIVIMTAFGDNETRTRAKNLGAVLLDKPFKMKTLREIVRALLRGPKMAGHST